MCKKLLLAGLFLPVFGLAAAHAQEVQWIKVAWWDSRYATNWASAADALVVRDGVRAAGYEILDADQLKTWMLARIADKKYSVVVFCQDVPPDTVCESMSSTCTLRKYLDAGGKIVFYADIPFYNQAHADGTWTNWAQGGQSAILGIASMAGWDSNTQTKITPLGQQWGLATTWASVRPYPTTGLAVLATDGGGNAAAWAKFFVKNDSFRGFVRLWDRGGHPPVEEIIRVAEYVSYQASSPTPADGATGVTAPLLMWQPGSLAAFQNVYLGTTPDLTEANLVGNHLPSALAMHFFGTLTPGTTDYWRVDGIGAAGTVYTGDVWSFMATPATAWAPVPADGGRYIDPNTALQWSAGMNATGHEVYFGTDRAAVEAGTGGTAKSSQATASYAPGLLARDTTYYWRVDEVVGDTRVTGSVWSFTTRPVIPKVNENLVGWWKLEDEKSGTAVDYSGWDGYGILRGDPQWVEGYYGDGLYLNGAGAYVDLTPGANWSTGTAPRTLCGWGKTDSVAGGWRWIAAYGSPATSQAMFIGMNGTDLYGGGYGDDVYLAGFWEIGVWHHIALTYDGTTARLYADGIEVASMPKTWNLVKGLAHIGRQVNSAAEFWDGTIDDVRIYNVALTPAQIKEVMRGDPLLAWNPQPKNRADVDIRSLTTLRWSAGDGAARHDVYFGTDSAAVKAADSGAPEYQGRQTGTSFDLGGLVAFGGGSYAWRIDEVEANGATVHRGVLWTFTVPDYFIVDDFESYTDEEGVGKRIYETWIDGYFDGSSGSTVGNLNPPFAERSIVHGGQQAMPLDYNNINAPYFSEGYREFSPLEDWSGYGVTDLTLWVRGWPAPPSVNESGGKFTLTVQAADIWGTSDQFTFVYKTLNGDGAITARVTSNGTGSNTWAKGGVMIRDSLEPGSVHGMMVMTGGGGNGASFQWRPAADGATLNSDAATAVAPPYYVKIERKIDSITASISPDGINWTQQGQSQFIVMTAPVYIGLCTTPNAATEQRTYQFDNVKTTGSVSAAWHLADVGLNRNGAQDLYVRVEDNTGKKATVTHPTAVNATDWTEWKIPLSGLAPVNLTKVKRLYIGVGDKDHPAPGGTGRVYIDDIRVTVP
jgi:hypothetical protein